MRKNAVKLYYFDDIARIRKTQNMSDVLCGKRYENGLYFYGAAGGAVCAQLAVRAAEDSASAIFVSAASLTAVKTAVNSVV